RRFAAWFDRARITASPYIATPPGLFRDAAEGVVQLLGFQLWAAAQSGAPTCGGASVAKALVTASSTLQLVKARSGRPGPAARASTALAGSCRRASDSSMPRSRVNLASSMRDSILLPS